MSAFDAMDRDTLLRALAAFAKNWLAHDGCWFLAVEEQLGLDTAIELDARAWGRFAEVEARRLMKVFAIPPGGGLRALERALSRRMCALVNEQHAEWSADGARLRFVMDQCHVQEVRRRKGLRDFPCRPVGTVEFTTFARTIDPRIATACLHCPPDARAGAACAWEFTLAQTAPRRSRRRASELARSPARRRATFSRLSIAAASDEARARRAWSMPPARQPALD